MAINEAMARLGTIMEKAIEAPLRQNFVMRKVVPLNVELSKGGFGTISVENVEYGAMSAAGVSMQIQKFTPDTLDPTVGSVNIPVIVKDFEIPRRLYESSLNKGIPLAPEGAIEAAYQVQAIEENMFVNGITPNGTDYLVQGLYTHAGNDYATSSPFSTYGGAITAVAGAKALIRADKVYNSSFNLILNTVQYGELEASMTANGYPEKRHVLDMLGAGGNIIEAYDMAESDGLLLPIQQQLKPYVDYIHPREIKVHMSMEDREGDTSPVYGRIREAIGLRIKKSVALCKLSAI